MYDYTYMYSCELVYLNIDSEHLLIPEVKINMGIMGILSKNAKILKTFGFPRSFPICFTGLKGPWEWVHVRSEINLVKNYQYENLIKINSFKSYCFGVLHSIKSLANNRMVT